MNNELFEKIEDLKCQTQDGKVNYFAQISSDLCDKITKLEYGSYSLLLPSGMSAISTVLISFMKTDSHFLISDGIYSVTRDFCDNILIPNGIEITYYKPDIGPEIQSLIQNNTVLIFCESPSSWSFEVQDISLISKIAKKKQVCVICDNTWSTPVYFNPIKFGADVVIHSLSKYVSGHSDFKLGIAIFSNEKDYKNVYKITKIFGLDDEISPLTILLANRSLLTLNTRLEKIQETLYIIINFLKSCDKIEKIYHPAVESNNSLGIWKRDFRGSIGLLSIVIKKEVSLEKIDYALNSFEHIKIGLGWGGIDTTIRRLDNHFKRNFNVFNDPERTFRISLGLDRASLIIHDLKKLLL